MLKVEGSNLGAFVLRLMIYFLQCACAMGKNDSMRKSYDRVESQTLTFTDGEVRGNQLCIHTKVESLSFTSLPNEVDLKSGNEDNRMVAYWNHINCEIVS